MHHNGIMLCYLCLQRRCGHESPWNGKCLNRTLNARNAFATFRMTKEFSIPIHVYTHFENQLTIIQSLSHAIFLCSSFFFHHQHQQNLYLLSTHHQPNSHLISYKNTIARRNEFVPTNSCFI